MMTKPDYRVLEDFPLPEYTANSQRVERIYRATIEKAGLPVRRWAPRRIALLAATLAAMALVTAAASFFSASDAFRGFLRENGALGEPAPLSGLSHIVDQTGTLLELPPSVSNGIQIQPKAIAGDDRTFVILFELSRMDGEPMGLLQQDGFSEGDFMFFRSDLALASGQDFGYAASHGMGSNSQGAKALLLQRFDLYESVPMGDTLNLTLRQLWQMAGLPGEEVGLGAGELHRLLGELPEVDDSALLPAEEVGFSSQGGMGMDYDSLSVLGEDRISVPLTGPLSGYTLTNAALLDGVLYLRGYAPARSDPRQEMRLPALTGGDYISSNFAFSIEGVDDASSPEPWHLAFQEIESLEQLEDLALLINCGSSMFPYAQGEWSFAIPLEYNLVSREVSLEARLSLQDLHGTLSEVVLSPYRVIFSFLPDDSGKAVAEQGFSHFAEELRLIMEDGSTVVPFIQDLQVEAGLIRGYYSMDHIIDPDQVMRLEYGDYSFELG